MTIPKEVIDKAFEGGWMSSVALDSSSRWQCVALDKTFWKALGNALGWETSKYRACEMKKPFYYGESKRGSGAIVGESKDKTQWYVRWDYGRNGKPTQGMGARQPYPKENISIRDTSSSWQMVARRFYDLILTGGDTDAFWQQLLANTQHHE